MVQQVGAYVTVFPVGDRVAYITSACGPYATERVIPAAIAVHLPPQIDHVTAGSVMLKGLNVRMLASRIYHVRSGHWVLVHAAAGSVGHLLVQAAVRDGATVIGTVGSSAKAQVARKAGCHHIVQYRQEGFVDRVREITAGRGVDAAYDSGGKDTFFGSLDSLAVRGHLVNCGQFSGPGPGFEVSKLAVKSATLSRPVVFHYTNQRADLLEMSSALFRSIADGNNKT